MQRRKFIALLGGAASWPLAARAQGKPVPVVGYLHPAGPEYTPNAPAFLQGLGEAGYIEGRDVVIEYRWAEGFYDRLPAMAASLVGREVALIAAVGLPCALAAKEATSTIPIVFLISTDPVAGGLVASLNRPGGNITGVSILAPNMTPKRLELISALLPQAKVIALLVNPKNANPWIAEVQEWARAKGVRLSILKASTKSEIDAAFVTLANEHADALVIEDDVFFSSQRQQLVALAARYAVPAIERRREFAASGGLLSYGPSLTDTLRLAGTYAGRILNGEKPADLPVRHPTAFKLVINLKTAKVLGLEIPATLLARADELIE